MLRHRPAEDGMSTRQAVLGDGSATQQTRAKRSSLAVPCPDLVPPTSAETDDLAWVEVDLPMLCDNACAILAACNGARLLAVVKANAYGLGAVPIAKALESVNPWGYAVATVEEGITLREARLERPILVLRPPRPSMRTTYVKYGLRPVVETPDVGGRWGVPFHVEVDTGMARTGVRWDEGESLARLGASQPEAAFTHLFAADELPETIPQQWTRFQTALGAMGKRPRLLHVANSAGVWGLERHFDLIRPGLFLYGGRPGRWASQPRPVVSVKATIISVRRLAGGESVSYGGDWKSPKDTLIATLPIGYADGVPRALCGHGQVLIQGRRCPVVGRVTMDMIMIDVGALPMPPQSGDVAVLIGGEGKQAISIDEFASWANTIPYEVLTGLGARLPRRYRHGNESSAEEAARTDPPQRSARPR